MAILIEGGFDFSSSSRRSRLSGNAPIRRMMRFLRRRDCGGDQAPALEGRCRNLRCTEPRATSSGYGDLIELAATAGLRKEGREDGGSARQLSTSRFTGRGLLAEDFDGSSSEQRSRKGRGLRSEEHTSEL